MSFCKTLSRVQDKKRWITKALHRGINLWIAGSDLTWDESAEPDTDFYVEFAIDGRISD